MPLCAAGSPLVHMGVPIAMEKPTTRPVRVLRAFRENGNVHAVGDEVELDIRLAAEMRTANKLEYIAAVEPSPPPAPANKSKPRPAPETEKP